MSFLISIIPTLAVLAVLIFIHELGHFIACRLTGVEVEKFSIGFGPEIIHWQGKKTRYVVSLFPLGGFVKPAGEAVSEMGDEGPAKGDYLAAPLASRIFIVCAGVLMNYFLAFVLFTTIFMMGRPIPGTTIGTFVDGYPAKESGLEVGDRIIQVNETAVTTWTDLIEAITESETPRLVLNVERTEQRKLTVETITMDARVEKVKDIFGDEVELKRLGITPSPEARLFEKYGFFEAAKKGFEISLTQAILTHKALFYMVQGKMSLKGMAGPIGIISMTGSAAKLGLTYVLQLAATLSISLAVINLLPFPALDGGHLLFLLIEGVRRKRVSLEVQEKASQVGFALLMGLMVFIVYNDLVNLEVIDKVKSLFGG